MPYDAASYARKLDWLADTILAMDADVIGFQELWRKDCLTDLMAHPKLANSGYTVHAKTVANAVSVAAITRIPVTDGPTWTKDFPAEVVLKKRSGANKMEVAIDTFSRPILHLRVKAHANAKPVHVWVAHLKSKRPMDIDAADKPQVDGHSAPLGEALSLIRRGAEAAALRVMVRKALRGNNEPGMVLGDLNDGQRSVVLSILTETPSVRLNVTSRAGRRSDAGLYAVSDLQEYRSLRDVYYTHIYEHRRESLDHILVSEQFYDYSEERRWAFRDMRVFNDHLAEFAADEDDTKSDHAAVVARFEYAPAD